MTDPVIKNVRDLNLIAGREGLSMIGPYRKLFSRYRDNSDWYIQESTGEIFYIERLGGAKIGLPSGPEVAQIKSWNNIR